MPDVCITFLCPKIRHLRRLRTVLRSGKWGNELEAEREYKLCEIEVFPGVSCLIQTSYSKKYLEGSSPVCGAPEEGGVD